MYGGALLVYWEIANLRILPLFVSVITNSRRVLPKITIRLFHPCQKKFKSLTVILTKKAAICLHMTYGKHKL